LHIDCNEDLPAPIRQRAIRKPDVDDRLKTAVPSTFYKITLENHSKAAAALFIGNCLKNYRTKE
jgi:hypothetical protein